MALCLGDRMSNARDSFVWAWRDCTLEWGCRRRRRSSGTRQGSFSWSRLPLIFRWSHLL